MHAVGICQTIGRITGCAMPSLNRRLYASKDVYDTYIKYNKNQEQFIKKIEKSNDSTITKDIIEELVFNKYKRSIDRMKLNLTMNMEDTESEESEDSDYVEGEIDGVDLAKLIKWINGKTLVGRMINYLYECEESITFNEFKEGLEYTESDKKFRDNIDGGRSLKAKYGKLWSVRDNTLKLNKNIKEYIDKI
jgi:hypothetical protein